jgi:F-box interacting protein
VLGVGCNLVKHLVSFRQCGVINLTLGLGLLFKKFKVVQCFRNSKDDGLDNSSGMEVLTIDDGSSSSASWRDVLPPYPVSNIKNAVFFKGSLIWILPKHYYQREPPETRLLRFCLQDETFSFTPHPPCPTSLDHQNFAMGEMDGEFCVAQHESSHLVGIWMTNDVVNPQWDRRYVLDVEPWVTMVISHGGLILTRDGHMVSKYNFHNKKMENVICLEALRYHEPGPHTVEYNGENLFFFQMIPYAESLVRVGVANTE